MCGGYEVQDKKIIMWRFTFRVVFKYSAPLCGVTVSYIAYHHNTPNLVYALELARNAYGVNVEEVYLVGADEMVSR
jgi:hypothetical protein